MTDPFHLTPRPPHLKQPTTPGFATPMPTARPHIAHADPAWTGDRPEQLQHIARGGASDFNVRWFWQRMLAWGDAVNVHWPDPLRNNYRWILDQHGRPRRLKPRELVRRTWLLSEVLDWRRPVYGKPRRRGGRRPIVGWERPHTYAELVEAAHTAGRIVVAELKTPEFARPDIAAHMVAAARAANHPAWFMALYGSLPGCEAKCAAIRGAGGSFAVIFGRASLQRRWRPVFARDQHSWDPKPTAVW